MKHRVYGRHLGRDKDTRRTLFKSLVQSLILHGTIETSREKAKAVKGLVDKVINLAKEKRSQVRLQSFINDKDLRDRLVKEIVPKLSNRNSGYTSLIRLGTRLGDQTMMVRMSLIGAEQLKPPEKESRVPPKARFASEARRARLDKVGKSPAKGPLRQRSEASEARQSRQESSKKSAKIVTKTGGKKS